MQYSGIYIGTPDLSDDESYDGNMAERAHAVGCTRVSASELETSMLDEHCVTYDVETMNDDTVEEPITETVKSKQIGPYSNNSNAYYLYSTKDHEYVFKDFEVICDPSVNLAGTITMYANGTYLAYPIDYGYIMAKLCGRTSYVDDDYPHLVTFPIHATSCLPWNVLIPPEIGGGKARFGRKGVRLEMPCNQTEFYLRFKKYPKRCIPSLIVSPQNVMAYAYLPITYDRGLKPNTYENFDVDDPCLGFVIPHKPHFLGVRSVTFLVNGDYYNANSTSYREIVFDADDINEVKVNGKKLCYIFGFSTLFKNPKRFIKWMKEENVQLRERETDGESEVFVYKHSGEYNGVMNFGTCEIDVSVDIEFDESYCTNFTDKDDFLDYELFAVQQTKTGSLDQGRCYSNEAELN